MDFGAAGRQRMLRKEVVLTVDSQLDCTFHFTHFELFKEKNVLV